MSSVRREVAIANAYRDAQKIKGEGDAEAARIYLRRGLGRDPSSPFTAVLTPLKQASPTRNHRDGC